MTRLDGASKAFQRALDEARRNKRTANADGEGGYVSKLCVRTALEFGRAPAGGGDARWSLAMTWADEPEVGRSAPTATRAFEPTRLDEDMAEAIAGELGVGAGLVEGQLTRRWRAFVWRNHPDRHPADARERANARVAIANTLYDQARRDLKKMR
jgi:hypothetical protein